MLTLNKYYSVNINNKFEFIPISGFVTLVDFVITKTFVAGNKIHSENLTDIPILLICAKHFKHNYCMIIFINSPQALEYLYS